MTDETMPSGLWQETRQAAAAWAQAQSPRGDEPARPYPAAAGQVLTISELGEPRLAWATLRREEGKTERRLLVVADVNPLVGSGDVAVTGPEIGSLTLRCRFAVWVSDRELGTTALLGALPPEALARADSRRQALEAGRPVGTFSEQETEEDPEYQDWIEDVVRPTVGKLEARAGAGAPSARPALPFHPRRSAEPLPSRRGAWMRWAAVLAFMVLGAGSGFLWWRQGQEITGLRAAAMASEASHRQEIAKLEARRAELEAQYQARLQKAGEDRGRLESEYRARLAEVEAKLAKLRQTTDVKNPVLAILEPAATQRGPKRLTVGPEVSHLLLVLPVDAPAGTEFQVDVSEQGSDQQVFVQKDLRAENNQVRLGLPAVLIPPGDYRLRLFRKDGGKLHLVREHVIEIVQGARSQRPR
jgi:hypothetical protein